MPAARIRPLSWLMLGLVPAAAVVAMFAIAVHSSSIAADFHNELYPQAELMLDGIDPYPSPDSDLSGVGNFVWPPLAVFVAAPATLLPVDAADIVVAIVGLLCMALALLVVGVRDWRVYGATALWPPVIGEMRTAHFTLALCLLAALAWVGRRRDASGVATGLAVSLKFFL